MVQLRKANDRGSAHHGWLQTSHSFSFADYYDPEHMGFRALRVINEDYIAPGTGFPTHGHRDMEIVSYVPRGVIEHKDTLGNQAQIRPGMIQKMSAGTGIRHSEYNPSSTETTRLIQIWIEPSQRGGPPSYSEKNFEREINSQDLVLVASPNGESGSMTLLQDARIWVHRGTQTKTLNYPLSASRYAWLQVLEGSLAVNGHTASKSDGVRISGESGLKIETLSPSEFLLFDLA